MWHVIPSKRRLGKSGRPSWMSAGFQQTQSICITFVQCRPTSKTLGRYCTNVIQMFCVCCVVILPASSLVYLFGLISPLWFFPWYRGSLEREEEKRRWETVGLIALDAGCWLTSRLLQAASSPWWMGAEEARPWPLTNSTCKGKQQLTFRMSSYCCLPVQGGAGFLAQFSLYVHTGGLRPDSFHFILQGDHYFNPYAETFLCKPWRPKGFFNLKSP